MVVIQGKCVMNESILTGESVPVVKTPIEDTASETYDATNDNSKKNTIFAGSKFLQVSHECRAIVIRTGFQTTKGNLIREIMFPKKSDFSFRADTIFFVVTMAVVYITYCCVLIPRMDKLLFSSDFASLKMVDLLTCAIPPILPAVLVSAIVFSMKWLQRK